MCRLQEYFIIDRNIVSPYLFFKCRFTALDIFFSAFTLEPRSYFCFCFVGFCDFAPVSVRSVIIASAGQYLNDVARVKCVVKRHHSAADLCACHFIADLRMNSVGKIYNVRACRQCYNIALRGENIYVVRGEIDLDSL